MIQIELIQSAGPGGGFCRLTAEGHAGTAAKGQDIVCAAVSALVQTLAAWVTEDPGQRLFRKRVELEEGRATVEASAKGENMKALLERFGLVGEGLALIAEHSPESVQYSDGTERKEKRHEKETV